MYAVFVLFGDKTLLCLPVSRCAHLDIVRCCNNGLNRNMKRRISYSPNKNKAPNFKLPLRSEFNPTVDCNYIAYCLRFFGTVDEARTYIYNHRNQYPAVYNDHNLREIAPSTFEPPDVKAMIEIETAPLRKAISYANTIIGIQDLTEIDVANFGDLVELAIDDDDQDDFHDEVIENDDDESDLQVKF